MALIQDLPEDLPEVIESYFKEVTKQIIGLKNKLEEIKAIEKYYERNFLFELRTNTQQKKKEIQEKLLNILLFTISDGEKAMKHHFISILRLKAGLRELERINKEL